MKPRVLVYGSLPHHLLSRLGGWMARRRWGILTRLFIGWFVRHYRVNLAEATRARSSDYASFADFFTRELRSGARTWPAEPGDVGCPVDGAVSVAGRITDGRLIQAKGIDYPAEALLGGDPGPYLGGHFATLYLRPQDYHRVHMPVSGQLTAIRHLPGRLWPVRPWAVNDVAGLFARNERVVLEFEGEHGPWSLVMVGAMMVGSMETVVTGRIRNGSKEPARWNFETAACRFSQGDEIGRFHFGSTVVLLFGPGQIAWNPGHVRSAHEVQVGETLARFTR